MIEVTRLDGSRFYVNADLIELVEANPDTVISLTTHRKFVIKESIDTLVEKIVEYKHKINTFPIVTGRQG